MDKYSQHQLAIYGFAVPYVVALWVALLIVIWGAPITEEGIRMAATVATGVAPISAALGWTWPR